MTASIWYEPCAKREGGETTINLNKVLDLVAALVMAKGQCDWVSLPKSVPKSLARAVVKHAQRICVLDEVELRDSEDWQDSYVMGGYDDDE